MKRLEGNPLVGLVVWRIKKNKNAIIVINGPTGSGKTYAALWLALEIAKEVGTRFTIAKNVDFNFAPLLKKTMLPSNTAPGTCFLFEETGAVGSGGSNREWQSKSNKFFSSFMQTTRHRRQVLILTCPNFAMIDPGTRGLVHINLEMTNIDYRNNVSYAKPFVLQTNLRTGKIYYKYPRVGYKGKTIKLTSQAFKLPPKSFLKEYEEAKNAFTAELNARIIREEEGMRKKKKDRRIGKVNPKAIKELLGMGKSTREVAEMLNVTIRTIQMHKQRIESKAQSRKRAVEAPTSQNKGGVPGQGRNEPVSVPI